MQFSVAGIDVFQKVLKSFRAGIWNFDFPIAFLLHIVCQHCLEDLYAGHSLQESEQEGEVS